MVTSTQSICEIISSQPSAAAILQRFDIDPCFRADEPLDRACAELQLSVDQVLEKLADGAANENGTAPANFDSYSPSRLIRHIVRTHHQHIRRELPGLVEMAQKLAGKHGDRAPELRRIEKLLGELRADILAHLQKEEQILFPFIAEMDQDSVAGCVVPHACFSTVAQPVAMMIVEHGLAENLVHEICVLTNSFAPPDWACQTHIALCAGLREFAADLRQHVHLENDVLFPRAIELEATLNTEG
jgi:regulator of cell morphogenesis and NO signaling